MIDCRVHIPFKKEPAGPCNTEKVLLGPAFLCWKNIFKFFKNLELIWAYELYFRCKEKGFKMSTIFDIHENTWEYWKEVASKLDDNEIQKRLDGELLHEDWETLIREEAKKRGLLK